MHREIMLSHTYRISSTMDERALSTDPTNELLSAFPRRRLDAESLRDTLLMLGGNLNSTPGGAHPFPAVSTWGFTQHKAFKAVYEHQQRSVYVMTQRIQRHPFLGIFDGADPSSSTPARATSTTPIQALYLLNDPFVFAQAQLLAERVLASHSDDGQRIGHLYQLLFARLPFDYELSALKTYLATTEKRLKDLGTPAKQLHVATWSSLIRISFRLNEFIYLD
jgi:hypothetical protein